MNFKTSLLTRSILLITVLFFSCEKEDPITSPMQTAVDRIVYPYVALGADVGIIVGIIKDGKTTVYSYGETEIGSRKSITPQSVLEIASLTKVYTSVALADMVIKNELSLDDPIEKHLPSSVHIPSYNGKKITLRHLANHTSGFPRFASNTDKSAYNEYKDYTEEMMYAFVNEYELTREPGTKFEYSGMGYGLLGQILSIKNNSNYEAMITQRVLQPLAMVHTSISFTPDQMANLVSGHNGSKQVESWAKYMQNIVQGTGALISNLDDQLIYLKANMGVVPSSIDQALALSHQLTFEHNGTYANGIGLGWNLYQLDSQWITWKNGGNGGYNAFMGFSAQNKTGIVILINSSLNPEIFATDMGMEILRKLPSL